MINETLAWRDGKCALQLVLIAFLIYNANLRSITSLDTYPTRFLPISIIKEGDLDLDEFPFLQEYPAGWRGDRHGLDHPYYVARARGHWVSYFPVMPAVLSVPVYVIPVLAGLTDQQGSALGVSRVEIIGTLLSKISASLFVAASVGVVYLTLLRMTTRRAALWAALTYGFATSSWAVSAQGLWQTSLSQPLLALAFYHFVRAREAPRQVVYGGIALALAVACRPTNVVFAAVLFAYVLRRHREQLLPFLAAPTLIAAWLVWYNLYYFDNFSGGYSGVGGLELFGWPRLEHLLGLLVSPSRGLLLLSPVLLFATWGLVLAIRRSGDVLIAHVVAASLLLLLLYSCWTNWHGMFSFGYRYAVDLLPGLSLGLGWAWPEITKRRARLIGFGVAAAFSVLVQVTGSFFYPCGWTDTPVKASMHRERFWDWTDPEFVRCLAAGPVVPDGVRFLQETWRPRRGLANVE